MPIQGWEDAVANEETRRYSLVDKFHRRNLSPEAESLRRVEHVPQPAGKINTQVQEQLFHKLGKDAYFFTQMTTGHYLFKQRLHLHNQTMNNTGQRWPHWRHLCHRQRRRLQVLGC